MLIVRTVQWLEASKWLKGVACVRSISLMVCRLEYIERPGETGGCHQAETLPSEDDSVVTISWPKMSLDKLVDNMMVVGDTARRRW